MKEKVLIKDPCPQNLDAMPRVKNGIFCTVCSEKVTDVTMLTDEELVKWIADNSQHKPCGIYTPEQAKIPVSQRFLFPLRYAAISIASLFITKTSKAQVQSSIVVKDSGVIVSQTKDSAERKITGKVTSKRGKPLDGVAISVASNDSIVAYVNTNADGTFECVLPSATDTSFIVSFSTRGYVRQTFENYVPCGQFFIVKMDKSTRAYEKRHRRVYSKF
jgi:hypothetical protein